MRIRLLLLLLMTLCGCWTDGVYFEDGYDHHYTYSSHSDMLGMHNVTTVIKFRIRSVNGTSGTSTDGVLHQLMVDSFVQHSEKGYVADNPLKWQLNHQFYFTVGVEGLVRFVHYHPEEQDEVLTLKKVLASTLTSRIQIADGESWHFTSEEEDHAGHMAHSYEGRRDKDGLQFARVHQSSKDVHRTHQKTMHTDNKLTPRHVQAFDNITLRHTPTKVNAPTLDGAATIEEDFSGEFPKVTAVSITTATLTVKSKHGEPTTSHHSLHDLKQDSIGVKQKQPEKIPLTKAVKDEMNLYIACIHAIPNKYDRNRTECVHQLREIITSLRKEDFVRLGTKALTKLCVQNDTLCVDERNLFIDLIAREASVDAQRMILDMVIRNPNVTEEDLRRCLFHVIAIESPIMELVKHVEELCFEEGSMPGETPILTKTRKRACLSLGAMAKSMHDKNLTESDRIVARIENWLDHHNESRSMEIVKPRRRRSIIQHDTPARKHIETKMVLLQSLGNAGKQRSIRHIRSYMEPNLGVTAWRRAAIHSLRHFKCNESAHALLTSVIHDNDDIVRKTALHVLKKHPLSDDKNFTVEHEHELLSKNYSYPIITRARRSLLQTLEEGIQVTIKPPGIEWEKMLGTSNIGAKFGLTIRNVLDLKLALLSGHFMVDLYDGAYADVHVGMINLKVEIVNAFICFKGHIEYDLNVLKDFGIDSLSDLVKIYDKILDKIVNPIVRAVQAFRTIITMFKGGRSFKAIVNSIVDVIKHLPTKLSEVAIRMRDFVKELFTMAGNTIIEEIKSIVKEVSDFIEGVKTDALKFYNDIVDAVTMALPYIAKKILDAFNQLVEGIGSLISNPMAAITSLSRAVIDVKTAITMAVDVKNKVIEACLFIKGRVVEWIDTAKKIPAILGRLKEAFKKLTSSISNGANSAKKELKSAVSDGVGYVKDTLQDLQENLQAKWDHVFAPLQPLIDFVKPFVDEFKAIMDIIRGVKEGYKTIKKVIEFSKSLVQKVFGPKFHRSFPTERRKKSATCKEGVWPSTTGGAYDTTGVDLSLGVGEKVPMPVNGILHKKGSDSVTVQPTDPEFIALEIVIENINPDSSLFEKKVKAGDKIGKATRGRPCVPNNLKVNVKEAADQTNDGKQDNTDPLLEVTITEEKVNTRDQSDWMSAGKGEKNFIHVSVRPAQGDSLADADYEYTDPSPFLDRLVPVPKWVQDCNDHEFRYIGQTFDSGESADGEEAEESEEKVKRHAPDSDEMDEMLGEEDEEYRPDDPELYDPKSFGDSLMDSLKEQSKQFMEFFKTALFGKNGPKIPNILEVVNVNNRTVDWIIDKLNADSAIGKKFLSIVNQLSCAIKAEPEVGPATLTPQFMLNFLKTHNLNFNIGGIGIGGGSGGGLKFGDAGQMGTVMMELPEKICPMFKDKIAKGFGHLCFVHDDCLGISCNVPLTLGPKQETIKASVQVKPLDLTIEASILGKNYILQPDGVDVEHELDLPAFKAFDLKVIFVANAHVENGSVVLMAEFKLCTGLFMACLPPVELFHDIKFIPNGIRHRRATGGCSAVSIYQTSVPTFMLQLGEFHLLTPNVTKVLENVRQTVVNELMKDVKDRIIAAAVEFKNKIDFCVSANIPVPPFDFPFFPPLRLHFMVGPIPMSFGLKAGGAVGMGVKVGICVVSMTTQLTLTPWVGGKVVGDLSIDIGFARGGLRLIGYLLETKFPMTTELVFSKYPIDVGARMDMVLTPLRLKLKAFAELNLFITTVTVFEGNIWQYSVPQINKNIFEKKKKDDDRSPPTVLPATVNERRKRAGTKGCIINQIYNRQYYEPAFKLEMYAQDEVSETKLFYAIGSHKGGTNLQDWTDMGGNSLMVPMKLPGGIPIYWSVKARNSQGLEAITQCSLDTYDSTLPDGRVEHPYQFSSHPNKIIASVVAFEDSPLKENHYKAVGFSPGQFGSQFVGWQLLRLDHSVARNGVSGSLSKFTIAREGKLVAYILKTQQTPSPEQCAQVCLNYGSNCVSFDYEHHSETCDLHDVVQGANAYLRISGTYSNYERLGSGYHTPIEYDNLPLTHGSSYFVNAKVTNVLGYDAYLIGEGTLVDFTPPEPGLITNAKQDILSADRCTAAVTMQCVDVTWKDNHRKIIDGPGSGTIFNGHEPVHDELYTLTNHYVSANWKGFHDDESGIWGYTWAVGKEVCRSDVIPFEDPYAHLTNKKFWTDSAFHKGIHLNDGAYFVTVQSLNGAELGGSLVTTVCHSTPFIVDTTPPVFHGVTDIIYDEDFDLIAIYYNATDDLSKIADAEFGLGKTKYDVQLKPYSLHASMDRDDPFVAVEELGLQEGIPAWIRIRVTNNVELFTAGHGDEPILIDKSPPIPGHVLDGDRLRQDRQFQMDDKNICAQWLDFYDPESGIDRFLWGVGTAPGKDDIVKFHNLTRYDKSSCYPATLHHNSRYYSTVLSYNNALNSKSSNSSSDGVLVDITPPIAGSVDDGKVGGPELKYSSETVSKYANWKGYYDPESGIAKYKVDVYINNENKRTFDTEQDTNFEDHTISMEHNDEVYVTVHALNGADNVVSAKSDGFKVDQTPPIMTQISDNDHGLMYQSDNTKMSLQWDFFDHESGIDEYRVVLYETKYGVKQKHWPAANKYNRTVPTTPFSGKMDVTLDKLTLQDGATYSLHVSALNGALLSTAHETKGVTIDTTAPQPPKVKIGLPKDEEELNDDGDVLHDDQNGVRVSWSGRDSESGIKTYLVAIGIVGDSESILPFTDYSTDTTAYINNIYLPTTSESKQLYVISVKGINGAGLVSQVGESKHIYVQKANVPGIVFDGRTLYEDESYTIDHTSIAASFYGFYSESCDIMSYDWAIGTTEYGTDVLSYTDYGVVMHNKTHGQCQIHTELFDDVKYFITIRAVTGCRDEYIVSCSDGITLDRHAPEVIYQKETNNDTVVYEHDGVIYQDSTDSLNIQANVSERHAIAKTQWALGSLPLLDDRHSFTDDFSSLTSAVILVPGEATFITANTVDKAGNVNITSSLAIIADKTPPTIEDLSCTNYISVRKSLVTCEWLTISEHESLIKELTISMGSNRTEFDIVQDYVIYKGSNSFSRDLYHHLDSMPDMNFVYIRISVSNVVGQSKTYGHEVIVDRTGPEAERLNVVTSVGLGPVATHQKCQLPRGYTEVQLVGVVDEESGIDETRYEAAVGVKPYGTEIHKYTSVTPNAEGLFFLDGFRLNAGATFYTTVRIYNNAGLKTEVTSDTVVVSQMPYLDVIDGDGETDIDYQSVPNLIQGSWEYSDACPIKEAYWSLENLAGTVLFDFQPIPNAGKIFYNDEVALENGMKYIVTVKTIDFLDRTKVARSDGVSVRIQPPLPGLVRDGLDKDLNYQFSTTELSANWDDFGDKSSDPTQSIHHYEIAIGNDRRYAKTRSNVHFFVNVGLNNSYVFTNLNLTAKLVRYYITVRSYSMAGSFTEGYTNGIRVGFNDDIKPGEVSVSQYQSSENTMEVYWNGFQSDIDIIDYKLAISSHDEIISNDTLQCEAFTRNVTMYDISHLHSVDLNTYIKQENIVLEHGQQYYATVVAEDEAGMCIAVTSEPVLVDTTPPEMGKLFINHLESKTVAYVKLDTEMHVEWKGFVDNESNIRQANIKLYECSTCITGTVSDELCFLIDESNIQQDTETAFYELEMISGRAYYVVIEVENGAKLTTSLQSSAILIDKTSPLVGQVKIANSWDTLRSYQDSTTSLSGLFSIASTWDDYICPSQIKYFPPSVSVPVVNNMDDFSEDFLEVNSTGAFLGIGYNSDLTDITRSGVISQPTALMSGNFTFSVSAATGVKIITTIAIVTDQVAIPFVINDDDKPIETEFDYSLFANISGLQAKENATDNDNITTTTTTTTTRPGIFVPNNDTGEEEPNYDQDEYGFGIDFLGYKIDGNKDYHHVFWARSKYTTIQRWFQLKTNPTTEHSYIINVAKKSEYLEGTIDITLIIDGDEIVNINGFKFAGNVKFAAATWSENGYKPPIDDIYKPFYSEAVLKSVYVPDTQDRLCRHGRGFYDGESGIKEIWIGASDNINELGNIYPLTLYKSLCYPCIKPCDRLCQEPCSDDRLSTGFEIIPLQLTGLKLEMADLKAECQNVSNEVDCNSTAYYLNVKVVNFAGEDASMYSNAIQIDATPPECNYVKCLDPEYSEDEPTNHLGSSSTIGAYWNCTEDVSQIENYNVTVYDMASGEVKMESTSVGVKRKVRFDLRNGTFENGKNYKLELTVINSGGLTRKSSCSVLVNLYPPDVSKVNSDPLYIDPGAPPPSDDTKPYWADSQTKIGIQWSGGTDDTEFYEWKIGTKEDGRDLFPPVKVGANSSGSSAIVHGKVHYNSVYINRTVSNFRNTSNMTTEEIMNATSASGADSTFFNMEPGRCVHQTLMAVGYSHLKSKIKDRTVCMKRVNDIYLDGTKKTVHAYKETTSNKWQDIPTPTSPEIIVDAEVSDGGITLGTLTSAELSEDYGSAATADYKPFIADIELTKGQTSRLLRNRIEKTCAKTFYLSPAAIVEFTYINISVTIPSGCEKNTDFQPALVYWDVETEQWQHIDEGCYEYLTANVHSTRYNSSICGMPSGSITVSKRSDHYRLDNPREFNLVRISRSFPNSKPKIVSDSLDFIEDETGDVYVETIDAENDIMKYSIIKQPTNMACNISENGELSCRPEDDFYGDDSITVEVEETGLPQFEEPFKTQKRVTLQVAGIPDRTERFFFDRNDTFHEDKRPSMRQTIIINANRSSKAFGGKIVLADVDGGEVFTELPRFTPLGNATYTLKKSDQSEIPMENYTTKTYRTIEAYDVDFEFSPELNGNMTLEFIAKTADDSYTPAVTINVFVLENPCINGDCSHPTLGPDACNNTDRSQSFIDNGFECICTPGYIGVWCESEINECDVEPCSTMYDCEDLINAYTCNINIPKLVAIIVCSLIAIVVIVFVLRRLIQKYKHNKISQSTVDLMEDSAQQMQGNNPIFEEARPSTPAAATELGAKPSYDSVFALSSLTSAAGQKLPPHHRMFPFKKSANDTRDADGDAKKAAEDLEKKLEAKVPQEKPKKFSPAQLFQNQDEHIADADKKLEVKVPQEKPKKFSPAQLFQNQDEHIADADIVVGFSEFKEPVPFEVTRLNPDGSEAPNSASSVSSLQFVASDQGGTTSSSGRPVSESRNATIEARSIASPTDDFDKLVQQLREDSSGGDMTKINV